MKNNKLNWFYQGQEKIKYLSNLTILSDNISKVIDWLKTNKSKPELAVLLISILMFLTMCKNADNDITQENENNKPVNPPIKIENVEIKGTTAPVPHQTKSVSELIKAEEKHLSVLRRLPTKNESDEKWAKDFLARNPIGINAYVRFKETFYNEIHNDGLKNPIWHFGLRYITVYPFENMPVFIVIDPRLVGEDAFEQQKLYLDSLSPEAAVFMFYNFLVKETVVPIIRELRSAELSAVTDQEIFSYIFKRYQHQTDATNAIQLMHSKDDQTFIAQAAKAHYYCTAKGAGSIKGRLWEYLIAIGKIKPSMFLKHNLDYFATGVDTYIAKQKETNPKADFDSIFVQKKENSFTTNEKTINDFVKYFTKHTQDEQNIEKNLTQNLDIILQVFSGEYQFKPTEKQIQYSKKMVDYEEKFVSTTNLPKMQEDRIKNHVNLKESLAKGYRNYLDHQQNKQLLIDAYEQYVKAMMKRGSLPDATPGYAQDEIETTLNRIRNLSREEHKIILQRLIITAPNKYKKFLQQILNSVSDKYRQQKTR